MSLNQQLGYDAGAKLLIVNADDYGMCHSVNRAVQQLFQEQVICSSTMMIPCGWSKEAGSWAAANSEYDVGVHLTFTSEWEGYKWGPVTRNGNVQSLVTEQGHFPADCPAFESQAIREHVQTEVISQIEAAYKLGFNPTHLDNHMGSLYGLATGNHFIDVVFEACIQYGLPFRMPRHLPSLDKVPKEAAEAADQVAQLADHMGVVILDYLVGLPFRQRQEETYDSYRQEMMNELRSLQPGVTEIIIHPAFATEELRSIHSHADKRRWDFELFRDPFITELLEQEGITLIKWSDLQALQRSRGKGA